MIARNHGREGGFTLTELMVALAVGMMLIAASYATFIAQNRSHVAQEGVSEVNTQSNIVFTMLANDLKMAGFGTSERMNEDPVGGFSSPITVTDSSTAPDSVTVVAGFRLIGSLGTITWNLAEDTNGDGTRDAVPFDTNVIRIYNPGGLSLADGDGISIDGVQFAYVAGAPSQINSNEWDVTLDRGTASQYPILDLTGDGLPDNGGGRPVYRVQPVTYAVVADCNADGNTDDPCLRRTTSTDSDTVGEHIEDMQFALAVDSDENGSVDDVSANGQFDEADFVDGSAVTNPETIRLVRVNVLARTKDPDPNMAGQGNPPASIENRNHAPTNDGFKRRWWRSMVKVRNG